MICWKSKNCINDLQQADELSKLNYNGLAERYSLQRDTDKCQFIWNDVRSFEMLTFTYNLIKTLLVSGLPFKTYAPQDRFFDLPSPCRHMYAFRVPPFFVYDFIISSTWSSRSDFASLSLFPHIVSNLASNTVPISLPRKAFSLTMAPNC